MGGLEHLGMLWPFSGTVPPQMYEYQTMDFDSTMDKPWDHIKEDQWSSLQARHCFEYYALQQIYKKCCDERLAKLLSAACKCSEGLCYKSLQLKEVQQFMDQFEQQGKREQDAILPQDEEVDLSKAQPVSQPQPENTTNATPCPIPASMPEEEFKTKYPNLDTTVVLEEQTSQGSADTNPMSVFDLIVSMEKKGILDCKLTGHTTDRPAAVRRGEERDRIEVVHQSFSLFKPNAVTAKNAKATNLAGLVGYKSLSASSHLQLVWRHLD
eukprot:Skav200150  [mRNA]  locus=scaffold2013:409300:426011:+ [translate_table: standard]